MFKTDKKVASVITGIALASSIALPGCSSKNASSSNATDSNSIDFISIEEATQFVVFEDNGVVMIIPTDYYYYDRYRFRIRTYYIDDEVHYNEFVVNNIAGVFDNYESAKSFAFVLSDDVYLYEDVVNGNPVNLVSDNSLDKGKSLN